MGSRAFGELLLRPSTFTRITPAARLTPGFTITQRSLSSSIPKSAAQNAEKPSTATTPEIAASSPRQQRAPRNAATAAIDDLFSAMPTPNAASGTGLSAGDPQTPSSSSSSAERVFGASFSRPSRTARRPNLQFDTMMMPADSLSNPSLANKPNPSTLAAQQSATFENYPRLNPTYGRSVDLDASRGRDIVRGIGMLGSLVARNKIKMDFNKQKFHERGGLKRKRLNSERWRARFKKGFQQVTGRVMELTRKGW
ncbi:hypothetical protein E8E13_008786 [Curvularia kusanoi]|uniref:Ribosomal protein S21 n=1 Tax=Curvularia kusanoi TaxID=90978 RepID=A0A9P4TC69_CURKU|nr:hypothetical protein E8E13_008786 [Curvularia kusanoi]